MPSFSCKWNIYPKLFLENYIKVCKQLIWYIDRMNCISIWRPIGIVFDDKREENLKEKLVEERKEKAEYAKKVGQLTMQVELANAS